MRLDPPLRRVSGDPTVPPTMENNPDSSWRAWSWVPSLYFCQGVPNFAVAGLSVVMFKNLQVSNADIALYTSWLYLPWVIKPLWSPFVDMFGSKRRWIFALQLLMGAGFGLVAFTLPGPDFFRWTLAILWLVAFSSATHDIAADGFYLLSLPPHQQAAFVGVRSTFFRLSNLAVQGGLVWLAGHLVGVTGGVKEAWVAIFCLLAGTLALAALYHAVLLPRPAADRPVRQAQSSGGDFLSAFSSFFAKKHIGAALFFLLTYRLAEAQALRLVQPFLLDARAAGGLGLGNEEVGFAYGGVGVASLLGGGLLGGWLISRHGLKRMLWPMVFVMHVPIGVFVALAATQPGNLAVISAALAVEQFGYGFGFTGYMVFMMLLAEGERKTAHYAICTGFMALGLMLPGMLAGRIQEALGYTTFFAWVCVATLPSFAAVSLLRIDPAFGRKAA